MRDQIRNPKFYAIVFSDMALIAFALLAAYLIRFEFVLASDRLSQFSSLLPYVLLTKAVVFFIFGLYRGMWRYAGVADLIRIVKAVVVSSLAVVSLVLFVHRFDGFSRAIFLIDGVLTLIFIGGFRLMVRMVYESHVFDRNMESVKNIWRKENGKRILIIGAGDAGEKTLRELRNNPRLPYWVIGFIDDASGKRGRLIHSVPVLGSTEDLADVVKKNKIEEILIAMPSASGMQMRRVVDQCESCDIPYKTLPGMGELIDGQVSIKDLRDVNYQDLLGRAQVTLDEAGILSYLKDKTVLVTGAGGSIGSELCRQISRYLPEKLVLLDASEPNLYQIEMELKQYHGHLNCATVLGEVQDKALIRRVFMHYQPHVVFHAAAYKHVPMLEINPWQAVMNNVRGAQIVMEQSVRSKVANFVLVSTDKAVRPTNVMGTSKRICELLLQSYMGNGTRMMAVRFGNVVGSSGSVIPLFRRQIAAGGPVTVTHREVTRFFMTIPEASQLILQAGALGSGGEVFILKMGTPVKIADMARDLIRLSGKKPDEDIKIVFTGLRPGEKLYEELITEGEGIVATAHDEIMVLKSNGAWNGYGNQFDFKSWLNRKVEELYDRAENFDECGIKRIMNELVPEYKVNESDCTVLNDEGTGNKRLKLVG